MEHSIYAAAVTRPFEVYNSIFLTLPLDGIRGTGLRVPLFAEACRQGLADGRSPMELLLEHMEEGNIEADDQMGLLFRYVQYIERQVVLVDALEDARYEKLNELDGAESLAGVMPRIVRRGLQEEMKGAMANQKVRVVLTAHPTQFYPGSALGIITDLTSEVRNGDLESAHNLLHQLGLTPFFQAQAPTPYEEAVRQTWYLEHVFFEALPNLAMKVSSMTGADPEVAAEAFTLGFWPGGDRDGNPYVDAGTTLRVARRLRLTLLRCYRRAFRQLRRRITFKGLEGALDALQANVEEAILSMDTRVFDEEEVIQGLQEIEAKVRSEFGGLHAEDIMRLRLSMVMFGRHFAAMDIRQDSRVLKKAADAVGLPESVEGLLAADSHDAMPEAADDVVKDVVEVMATIQDIQQFNGPRGCHRFIISNCRGAVDVLRLFALARVAHKGQALELDLAPLFETVDDLAGAASEMRKLLSLDKYRKHVATRSNVQHVMLGFSDGTKDGGYLMANWSIHQAKESLSAVCAEFGVEVVFFDGRGGPPARGGGNTHRFYASLGPDVQTNEVQTTIQGQSISSNFGTPQSASYNMELLLTAGLQHRLIDPEQSKWSLEQRALMNTLADRSYEAYAQLKDHPAFMEYLSTYGTLRHYGATNIASRPTRRKKEGPLTLDDLRAIPFVGSWSQLKQNVPGFYGIGVALASLEKEGRLDEVAALYRDQPLFAALLENSMQSMRKCNFALTAHLEKDARFGDLWCNVKAEFEQTRGLLLRITGQSQLMERSPAIAESIDLRESIILPLLVIQQAALQWLDGQGEAPGPKEALEKLIVRTMFGIVNAGRNAV